MLKEFAEPGKPVNAIEKKIVYFDQISGLDIENMTKLTCELAIERALDMGIRYIVLAYSSGNTVAIMGKFLAENGVKVGADVSIVSVGSSGRRASSKAAVAQGMIHISGTPVLSGIDRSTRSKYGGIYSSELIAASLKRICQGMKVCVEIAVMAADQGVIPMNEDIVCVAGTHLGADTAVVLRASLSKDFFDEDKGVKIREIICMPYVRSPKDYRKKYGAQGV